MKKWVKYIMILIIVGLVYVGIVLTCIYRGAKTDLANVNDETVMLVLGAKVNGDPAYPSDILKERLDTAAAYLKEHPNMKVVVSGAKGEDESQAEGMVMKSYLSSQGIDEARISVETESTRTLQNIQNSVAGYGFKNVLIVTSEYHMYRSVMLAERQGLTVSSLSAPTTNAEKAKNVLREVFSITYAWVFDRK